ncbi:hypothetical protein V1292_000774 [Bradyrhizobium sp. AZCC 1719]|uniref:hypothetical protein n=1 Tax=Bradyrhizobium sp. AZCC 1719 TaxID=3117028 RepID=UPI002FF2506D
MRNTLLHINLLCSIALSILLAGCLPSTRTPERLYPIVDEMNVVRATQEELVRQYNMYVFSAPVQAKLIRNEIIAQRMYAIDVQYTQYETALTREGQEVGFGALTTAGALGTASTLFTPVVTKSVLSGLSTAVLSTKGYYESEILVAQTIRTIQKQMRASRNQIASSISAKIVQSVSEYPLSAALSDLEEYYAAGTLTSGVIDTSTTVGIREATSREIKEAVTQAPPAQRAAILEQASTPAPVVSTRVVFTQPTDITARIRAFSNANSKNQAAVEAWLAKNGVDMPIAFFLRSSNRELQQRMVRELGIP